MKAAAFSVLLCFFFTAQASTPGIDAVKPAPKTHKNEKSKVNFEKPITISGDFQRFERELTPAQRLKKKRKKLEKQTALMVQKQIQALRLRQEIQLQKRLEVIMNEQIKKLNQIQ